MRAALLICVGLLLPAAFAQGGWREENGTGPWARSGHNVEAFSGKIWSFNGSIGATPQADLWSSADGVNWTEELAALPWNYRTLAGTSAHGGRLWMMGGAGGGIDRNDVWSSGDGVNWSQETPAAPWQARTGFQVLSYAGKLWVLGGGYQPPPPPFALFNDVWSTTDGINWNREVAAAAWSARAGHKCVVHNGRMWVIGGADYQTPYNDVWSSDDGINWVQETAAAPWTPRVNHTATSHGGRIWVVGGEEPWGMLFGDVWSSADGKNWRFEGQPWLSRYGQAAVVFNGRLWLIGGGSSVDVPGQGPTFIPGGVWSYGVHVRETTLPMGRVDVAYTANVEARGGEGPYTWTLTGGALPPGLALGTSTTELLPISGTPTQSGQFTFTLRVEESSGDFAEETITLLIQPVPAPDGKGGNSGGLGCTPAAPGLAILALLAALLFSALRRRRAPPFYRPPAP